MGIKKRAHPIEETDVPHVGMVRVGRTLEHPVFGLGEVVDIARWESGDITPLQTRPLAWPGGPW